MPSLELSRQRSLCIEVFKAINNLSPKYMSDLFPLQDTDHNTRTVNMIVQSHYEHVNYGVKSFKCYATHLWNNLPNQIKMTNDIDAFRANIDTWYGPTCKCNICKALVSIT